MGDLKTLPATLDQLGEAERDQTWHYVRMLELEEQLLKREAEIKQARDAWMNTLSCLEMSWRYEAAESRRERAEWFAAKERVRVLAAQADELCS